MARPGTRREPQAWAAEMRERGVAGQVIAATLRDRYGVNARVAARLARGWSQADTAEAWCARWPDEPKTFKNISYWENWPSPTGHAPSLAVLDRLAQLYACDVADLLAGWGEHGRSAAAAPVADAETLAWQVQHLGLPELTRTLADWSRRLPDADRRTLLLTLSTAASVAAGRTSPPSPVGRESPTDELAGWWTSRYRFHSTGRDQEFVGEHRINLRASGERLVGRSEPTDTGTLELGLRCDGLLVSGSWTERTAATGYYAGAVYHGIVALVRDPTGRSMRGRWLGPYRDFVIDTGPWELVRAPG